MGNTSITVCVVILVQLTLTRRMEGRVQSQVNRLNSLMTGTFAILIAKQTTHQGAALQSPSTAD